MNRIKESLVCTLQKFNVNLTTFGIYRPRAIPMVPPSIPICDILRKGTYMDYADDEHEPNIALYDKISEIVICRIPTECGDPLSRLNCKHYAIGDVVTVENVTGGNTDCHVYYIDADKETREVHTFFDDILNL